MSGCSVLPQPIRLRIITPPSVLLTDYEETSSALEECKINHVSVQCSFIGPESTSVSSHKLTPILKINNSTSFIVDADTLPTRALGTMNPRQRKYYDILVQQSKLRGFQVLGIYINNDTKIQMRCPNKHIIEITPDSFKHGSNCARCSGHCPLQSEETLYLRAAERGYQVLGTYRGTNIKIQMQCPSQHIIEITPYDFTSNHECAVCYGNSKTQSKEDLYSLAVKRGYQILGTYFNAGTKISMKCPNKHVTEIRPDNFKSGAGCSICDESSGEQLVRTTLEWLKLPFTSQYVLSSLPSRRYDFVVTLLNQQRIFIEWDGPQHFIVSDLFHFGEEEKFIDGQGVDILKTQEVINHRCKMIRIDYTWLQKGIEAIGRFIIDGIKSSQALIVSSPGMYQWLSSKIVIPNDMDSKVEKRRSVRLIIKDNVQV